MANQIQMSYVHNFSRLIQIQVSFAKTDASNTATKAPHRKPRLRNIKDMSMIKAEGIVEYTNANGDGFKGMYVLYVRGEIKEDCMHSRFNRSFIQNHPLTTVSGTQQRCNKSLTE